MIHVDECYVGEMSLRLAPIGKQEKTSIAQECVGRRTTRFNADGGTRTHDLMLRRQALYPLSYVSMGTV